MRKALKTKSLLHLVYFLQLVKCPFGLLHTKYMYMYVGEAIEVIESI